ncbi:MAG: cytochrome c oxidase subunit 3 [Verrucomicrobia bacterium]|nr:cytochrome c oxidase subunit 3 [Cytophagales bacterium]
MKTSIENKIAEEEEIFQEQPRMPLSMNPLKFALWLFIATIVMMFAAWTSAFLVRRAEGEWLNFQMPFIFSISTFIILLSSGTMQWAYFSARKDNLNTAKIAMTITMLLALAFFVTQYLGWQALEAQSVFFSGNPSGSFFYLLTVAHAVHLVSGIVFIVAVIIMTFQYKIHAKSMLWMDMCTSYWHFLDFLWVYLFAFLLIYH